MSCKEDYLTEDVLRNTNKYCCISVVSPHSDQKCDKMCIIIRGGYDTYEEAMDRVTYLQGKRNNKYNVWIGQIGYWLPICFNKDINPEVQLDTLNQHMKDRIKNKIHNDLNYKNRTTELKDKIKEEQEIVKEQNKLIEDTKQIKLIESADQTDQAEQTEQTEQTDQADQTEQTDQTVQTDQTEATLDTEVCRDISKQSDYSTTLTNDNPHKDQTWCCVSFLTPGDQTTDTIYGFKVRGIFKTLDEAKECSAHLQKIDIYNHIFIASVGNWLTWDPDPNDIKDQIYENETLNSIFEKKEQNNSNLELFNEKNKVEEIESNLENEMKKSSDNQKEIIDKIFE